MTAIDINALTPEQKKELQKQLREEQKAEKEKRASDLQALEDLAKRNVTRIYENTS